VSKLSSILLLLVAALLEAGGDAIIRRGMVASFWPRAGLFVLGGGVLFLYGYTVNRPPWKFNELLGLYVVFFFVVAQVIAWCFFQEIPTRAVWIGGVLIVGGGLVIALSR
jgi:small multidrug resistance family-3 protein